MPHTPETKPSPTQPNIQDSFLNFARREKLLVVIRLMDGQQIEQALPMPGEIVVVLHADHHTELGSLPSALESSLPRSASRLTRGRRRTERIASRLAP